MRRVLFVTLNATGNVPPQLAFADRLHALGHAVKFLAHDALRTRVIERGCEFSALRWLPDHYAGGAVDRGIDWWRDVFFASAVGDDVDREIVAWSPDLIVIDCLLWGGLTAAQASRRPVAVFVHTVYGRFSTDHSGENLGQYLPLLNNERVARGLPPVERLLDAWDEVARVVVATPRAFDFTEPAPAANVRHVGALRPDPCATDVSPPAPDPADVVISFSTSPYTWASQVNRVLAATGELPLRGLVTTGPYLEPSKLACPENVEVVQHIDHDRVMPGARVAICHGGHGTVLAALSAGVPVLCLVGGADQPAVATRAEQLGVGIRLPWGASSHDIGRALRELLDDAGFASRAEQLAAAIAWEGDGDPAMKAARELVAL